MHPVIPAIERPNHGHTFRPGQPKAEADAMHPVSPLFILPDFRPGPEPLVTQTMPPFGKQKHVFARSLRGKGIGVALAQKALAQC